MEWDAGFLVRSPMFEPLRAHAGTFGAGWPRPADLQRLLDQRNPPPRNTAGTPLRVVAQGRKPVAFEDGYEPRLYLRGELQVREGSWHDLFNVLVWLAFPLAKAALNERHYEALEAQRASGAANRGPVQDALTLFDEGGVIVASSADELLACLRAWRWKDLFWDNRARLAAEMRFHLFGHAVYEKALQPFLGRVGAWSRGPDFRGCDGGGAHKPTVPPDALQPTSGSHLPQERQALLRRPSVTSRGILLRVEPDLLKAPLPEQLAALDAMIAQHLGDERRVRTTRDLAVVPVLGVPGWHADNDREEFYDDTDYFRPARSRENSVNRDS